MQMLLLILSLMRMAMLIHLIGENSIALLILVMIMKTLIFIESLSW